MTARPRNSSRSSFSRDAWLEVDLNALEHNYHQIKALVGDKKIMAVVKSDAYGHGASVTAPLLEACGVDYFGVASVDEGIQLREAGIKKEILILSPTPTWAFSLAIQNNLQITLSDLHQLDELTKLAKKNNKKSSQGEGKLLNKNTEEIPESLPEKIKVQIKINTGMNRNGAKWNTKASELIKAVLERDSLFKLCGVFSHLACGSEDFFSQVQADRFDKVISEFDHLQLGILHMDASSFVNSNQAPNFDMVRIGLSLYGLGKHGKLLLKPALSLYSRVSQLQEIESEEAVGYGLTWRSEGDSLIGLLPLGYADGIKRGLSNRIRAIYKDKFIPQIGTISMDQTTFDLTQFKGEVKVGDIVTLIGKSDSKEIHLNEWSQILNTIDYEIACDLRARLPRVYVRK